jgi:hypothetical protein
MKNKNKKVKIAIIGPYPPPYGGISVHIQRVRTHHRMEEFLFIFKEYYHI